MSTNVSYRYQLSLQTKAIAVYYFILLCVNILVISSSMIAVSVSDGDVYGSIVGLEFSTIIFLFVAGCSSFKEEFGMLMQNGVSRRSLFTGRLLTSLTVAFAMTLIDKLIYLFFKFVLSSLKWLAFSSFFDMIYYADKDVNITSFKIQIISFLFHFSFYLFSTALGYLTTVIFYRMGKSGKLAFSVGLPVGFLVLLPMLDSTVTKGKIFSTIFKAIDKGFGITASQPLFAVITCCLAFVVLSIFSWLIIKKAYVKD